MKIYFKSGKLNRACSSAKEMQRMWGADMARKLQARLAELDAASSLEEISKIPPARCHELKGARKGQLSIDLVHPYRLLFVPNHDPIPKRADGSCDWSGITEIIIDEVADTH